MAANDLEPIADAVRDEMRQLPAIRAAEAMVTRGEVSVEEVVAQHEKIVAVMQAVMKEGVHYGKIPGIQKPALFKPGAEALNVTLRLAPDYESEKIFEDDGHLTVVTKCTLRHIPTQLVIASGEGMCSTRESRYAWRSGKRTCPACGAAAIVKSTRKKAYFCISNEGGCGERFGFGSGQAKGLDEQDTSRVPNPDLPDLWNTVIKMAGKRSLIAAVLNGTAASDVFTQDVEDGVPGSPEPSPDPDVPEAPAGPTPEHQTGFPLPGSWPKVEAAIRPYGDQVWLDWVEFSKQAQHYVFGDEVLDSDKKRTMRQFSALAAKTLRDNVDVGIPTPTRSEMRAAWGEALSLSMDTQLAGPTWKMGPGDEEGEE